MTSTPRKDRLGPAVLLGMVWTWLALGAGPPVAVAATVTASNPAPIAISDATPPAIVGFCPGPGLATPYPSTVTVSGLAGLVGKVTVTLTNLSHARPDDLDIMLVGPTGKAMLLMSDAGGAAAASGVTLTFDDDAAPIPDGGPLVSGTFRPTDAEFLFCDQLLPPAPAAPDFGAVSLAHFLGANPNGVWKLFVVDDTDGGTGTIAGGWSLTITTLPTLVTGAGAGGGPHVRFFDVDGAGTVTSRGQGVLAYAPFFAGGVFVGAGFIRTDFLNLLPGVVTGAGAGGGAHVRVFGFNATTDEVGLAFHQFFAYDPAFRGGVRVGGAQGQIVTAPGPGEQPHVRLFDQSGSETLGFLAYDPGFLGGVFAATAVDADVHQLIATGPGPGGSPVARVFRRVGSNDVQAVASFLAFDPGFAGGVTVALGDVDGDGQLEVIVGAGPGGGPAVRILKVDDTTGAVTPFGDFLAFSPGFLGGVSVAASDVDGDGTAEVIVGAGPGGGPNVVIFKLAADGQATPFASFFPYDPAFRGGVNVAGF
jgi:hypothetical protein